MLFRKTFASFRLFGHAVSVWVPNWDDPKSKEEKRKKAWLAKLSGGLNGFCFDSKLFERGWLFGSFLITGFRRKNAVAVAFDAALNNNKKKNHSIRISTLSTFD